MHLWFSNFHPQAITYTLLAIGLLLGSGLWLSVFFQREKTVVEVCLCAPVLGIMAVTLATANLNYLGVPVKVSAFVLTGLFSAASLAVAWKWRARLAIGSGTLGWGSLCIALAAPLIFLAPYLLTGAYYAFNDAVYYASIADFVREHSYFSSTVAAPQYPWLSQMKLAQEVWARMGAQYVISTVSALTGADGAGVFLPVSGAGIFTACCGFWILMRALTRSGVASMLGVLLYAGNVTFVHYVGGLNFASQTLALGPMYVLVALFLGGLESIRSRIMAATILAGMASIYPEILPAAAVPIGLGTLLWLARSGEGTGREIGRKVLAAGVRWAQVIGIAFLLNPFTWVHLLPNVVTQYNSTSAGYRFLEISWPLMEMYFGLSGPETSPEPLLRLGSIALLAVAVYGVIRMDRQTRWLVLLSAAAYAGIAAIQGQVRHFPYAALKVLVYSFYLVPAALACGFATLLEHPSKALRTGGKVLCGLWLCFACWSFYRLSVTCYFSLRYPQSMSAGAKWNSLAEISHLAHIPKAGESTLIGCQPDSLARWIPYFFRAPVGDLFPSIYYAWLSPAVTSPAPFAWYLFYRPDTSWGDENASLFDNGLFTFSRPQTALIVTNDGWYPAEPFKGRYAHWMKKRGRLLVIAPRQDTITLKAGVGLAPDRQPKHLRYVLDGAPAGEILLQQSLSLETPQFKLSPGFHQLVLETDEQSGPSAADSRPLNLWFADLRITQPPPGFLDAARSSDAAFIEGLTEDRWVTQSGIRVTLHNPGSTGAVLQIKGESLHSGIPGSILVRSDDGASATASIGGTGAFECRVTLRVKAHSGNLRLTLEPGKTATPASLGINSDPRELGFRLTSIGIADSAPDGRL